MIATLKFNGFDTPIFTSGYVPSKAPLAATTFISAQSRSLVRNADGLFSNIPAITAKQMKKGRLL